MRRSGVDIAAMLRLIDLTDYIVPHTIRSAAELRVADHLAGGPRHVDELAKETGTDASALLRALRALACNGIFTEVSERVFGLTPLAELLRSDHPYSMRGQLSLMPAELYAWAGYFDVMRTGEPAFPKVHGQEFWDHLATHPDDLRRYDTAQRDAGRVELRAALRAYPWAELGTVVDVGGGSGAFLAGLLAAHPGLRGALVDLPAALEGAEETLAGVADRVTVVAGDAASVPLPAGSYVLKRVLCTFPDDRAAELLQAVAAAMTPSSRLLIMEPDGVTDLPGMYDLFLMVFTGGRVRTRAELTDLLAAAGLRVSAVHQTAVHPIVEAVRKDAHVDS